MSCAIFNQGTLEEVEVGTIGHFSFNPHLSFVFRNVDLSKLEDAISKKARFEKQLSLSFDDFYLMTHYYFTNVDLMSPDPRMLLVQEMRQIGALGQQTASDRHEYFMSHFSPQQFEVLLDDSSLKISISFDLSSDVEKEVGGSTKKFTKFRGGTSSVFDPILVENAQENTATIVASLAFSDYADLLRYFVVETMKNGQIEQQKRIVQMVQTIEQSEGHNRGGKRLALKTSLNDLHNGETLI